MTARSSVKVAPTAVAAILQVAGRWCRVRLAELVQEWMEDDARRRYFFLKKKKKKKKKKKFGLTREDARRTPARSPPDARPCRQRLRAEPTDRDPEAIRADLRGHFPMPDLHPNILARSATRRSCG